MDPLVALKQQMDRLESKIDLIAPPDTLSAATYTGRSITSAQPRATGEDGRWNG